MKNSYPQPQRKGTHSTHTSLYKNIVLDSRDMRTPLFIDTGIPHWLQPPKRDNNPPFAEQTWELLLDWTREGGTLAAFCRENPSPPEGQLRAWIHKDETRKAAYQEAKAIGAEKIEEELIDIADGTSPDNMILNDTNRDALRISTRKWLLGVWNRDRYGEKKQIDMGVTIDMGEIINEARARVENGKRPVLIEHGEVVDG